MFPRQGAQKSSPSVFPQLPDLTSPLPTISLSWESRRFQNCVFQTFVCQSWMQKPALPSLSSVNLWTHPVRLQLSPPNCFQGAPLCASEGVGVGRALLLMGDGILRLTSCLSAHSSSPQLGLPATTLVNFPLWPRQNALHKKLKGKRTDFSSCLAVPEVQSLVAWTQALGQNMAAGTGRAW